MGRASQRVGETPTHVRLKLPPHVKAYTVGDKTYFYFRLGTAVRLPGMPRSDEFMAAYNTAMANYRAGSPAELGAARTVMGSVNAAIVSYYKSAAFNDELAGSTQQWRRRCLEKFRKEAGDMSLRLTERRHVQKYISLIPKAGAQRNMGQALNHFWQHCVDTGLCKENVAEGTKRAKLKSKAGGIPAWTEEHVTAFKATHPLGSKAYLALALYLNFGVRKSDVVRIGPPDIKGDELANFQPQKTSRTGGHTITVPITQELREAIAATPVTGTKTFLINEWGKAFTSNGFGNKMRDWCDQAGLPQCSSHGLRKLCIIRLAELGLNTETIMSISGHKNRAEIDTYVAAFNRKKLARAAIATSEAAAQSASAVPTPLSKKIVRLDNRTKK